MARSKKAESPGKMVRVADGIWRRGDTKTGTLIARPWDPAKNGKGGKENITVRVTDHEDYRAAVAEAKRRKQEFEDRVRARASTAGMEETVASWAARWQDVVPNRRRESTRMHNAERVKAFVEDFGPRKLRDISQAEARMWIVGGLALDSVAEVAKGWAGAKVEADGTVVVPSHRGNLAAVRAMFTAAQALDLVDRNVFARMGLEQPKGRKGIKALEADELEALVATAGRTHGLYGRHVFGPMIEVAAWTGLRPGELFGLWPEQVDFDRRVLEEDGHERLVWPGDAGYERAEPAPVIYVDKAINAKTDEEYTKTEGRGEVVETRPDGCNVTDAPVPLLPGAEAALKRLDIDQLPRGEPIFRTTHGKHYTQRNHHYYWDPVRTAFADSLPATHWLPKRVAQRGKLGNLDFYELRHFFGTQLGRRGVSPYDIAKAMGHSDGGRLAMERYIHTEGQSAASRVNRAFRRVA